MLAYIVRRILYAFPILLGVNALTFVLFFMVNTPDDMARMHLGNKHVTEQAIETWKEERGYNKPLIWNSEAAGTAKATDTIFFAKSLSLFVFILTHTHSQTHLFLHKIPFFFGCLHSKPTNVPFFPFFFVNASDAVYIQYTLYSNSRVEYMVLLGYLTYNIMLLLLLLSRILCNIYRYMGSKIAQKCNNPPKITHAPDFT